MDEPKAEQTGKIEPYLPSKINAGIVPQNTDALDENDEKAFKRMYKHTSPMCLYTGEGESVSLRDFFLGQHIFLVLSGPSLNTLDLSLLSKRGIMTMGVNNSWSVIKPNLWISVDDPGNFIDIGWKDPTIIKFAPMGHYHKFMSVKEANGDFRTSQFRVRDMPSVFYFRRNSAFKSQTFLLENTVNWGCSDDTVDEFGFKGGRSVMLAAIKILYYLGFRNIYLLGADFKMEVGKQNYAFAQNRTQSSVNGNNNTYAALNRRFESLKPTLAETGLNVYNCYQQSGLESFPYMSFDQALKRAGERFSKSLDTEGWYDRKERERENQKETDKKKITEQNKKTTEINLGEEVEEDSD